MEMSPINHSIAAGIEVLIRGEDGSKQWIAPNNGRYPVAHIDTFMNRYTSLARVYRDADEALIDSRDNARFMWNDVGIRECIDARKRSVALLNWHLEPEDTKDRSQQEFCQKIEKAVRRIDNFTEYRYVLQNAIWLGKMGIQHRWQSQVIDGKAIWLPKGIHQDDKGWRPLHGDKIVYRQARPQMAPGAYEGQMGIRVGWMDHENNRREAGQIVSQRWRLETTDYGLAYFLSPSERRLLCVHKHHVEDAPYEDGVRAGGINGVGIRSVIYWEWKQKQAMMAFLMEFLERMAGGIQIWKYPQGNAQALAEAKVAAENYNSGQEHIMLVPVPIGENGNQYGVEIVEPGFQGVETLQHLIKDYFGDRVKRYVLGQKLSSEAEATGMGSGVAELHMDTLLQIIRSDATMHEETVTKDLIGSIIKINVEKKCFSDPGFIPRFVAETEEPDVDKKLEACVTLAKELKLKFRLKDLYDLAGMAMPGPDDAVNADIDPQPQGATGGIPGAPGTAGAHGDTESGEMSHAKPAENEPDTNGTGHADDHVQRYSADPQEFVDGSIRRIANDFLDQVKRTGPMKSALTGLRRTTKRNN